ncbi:MAG: helix-turn-helix domain-containing protein [bacterium]|nr:helix-turn-helix domain-containing protein [bacterium]
MNRTGWAGARSSDPRRFRTVDVRVAGLRSKLGDDDREPRFIATLRGIGHRFVGRSRSAALTSAGG